MNKMRRIMMLTAALGLFAALAFTRQLLTASAQTAGPLIITWQVNNYFPADFPGKAVVTPGAPVVAAVEMIQNNKLVNLANAQISWFVNDNLVQSGTGLKSVSFTANPDPSGLMTIRVQTQTASGSFQDAVSILAAAPFTVIDYPSLGKIIPANGQVTMTAWPYFFNVDSLNQLQFTWQAGGQTTTSGGNQITFQIGVPQSVDQRMLPVILTTQNTANPLEFSKTTSVFNIQ